MLIDSKHDLNKGLAHLGKDESLRVLINKHGKPDIAIGKIKTAVFVNGCFWHKHDNCKLSRLLKTNKKYWKSKIDSNINIDEKNNKMLANMGWTVITLWECELDKLKDNPKIKRLKGLYHNG